VSRTYGHRCAFVASHLHQLGIGSPKALRRRLTRRMTKRSTTTSRSIN
jgi:hypothetical protein